MKRTKVKIVAVHEEPNTPNWPCIDHDAEKAIKAVMKPLTELNPGMDFDVVRYTKVEQAKADYENDCKTYDGVLVLEMTCWKKVDLFYARQSGTGIPTIIADIPYCGSGSTLCDASEAIRRENLPVPLLSTLNYNEIAEAVRIFDVLAKMKQTTILVITNRDMSETYANFSKDWGCSFVHKTAVDVNEYMKRVDPTEAKIIAERWIRDADEVVEPTEADILESASLHIALREMMQDTGSDAVTVDCLTLSYGGDYDNNAHMYPCLSHFEMLNNGTIAVCEADVPATVTSLIVYYLTGQTGFVSDPVIDTSADQIIYAHCVACTRVYGNQNPHVCPYAIRSHAEDKKGASVQVYFPAGDKLTTTMIYAKDSMPSVIHSSKAVGSVGYQEACRSKLSAETNAENILNKWHGGWHRVTLFGEYRKLLMKLFRIKGIAVIEEDKD